MQAGKKNLLCLYPQDRVFSPGGDVFWVQAGDQNPLWFYP